MKDYEETVQYLTELYADVMESAARPLKRDYRKFDRALVAAEKELGLEPDSYTLKKDVLDRFHGRN